jgi:hypothetical protein
MNHIRSQEEISATWGKTHQWDSDLFGIDTDGNRAIKNPLYESIYLNVSIAEGYAMTNFRFNFMRLCYLDGYGMRWNDDAEKHKDILQDAKKMESKEYEDRILSANELTTEEHTELDHKNRLTFSETNDKTRFEIKSFYRVADNEELPEIIETDGRGKLRKQTRKLEIANADKEALDEMNSKQEDDPKLVPDIRHYAVENAFYSQVLKAVGINQNLECSEERYKADDLKNGLVPWVEEHRSALIGIVRLPASERLATNAIRYVGAWLGAMGIKQARAGRNSNGEYIVDTDRLAFMRDILQKRGTLSSITKEKIPENVPAASALVASINALKTLSLEAREFAEYNAALIELGAFASWGATA